MAAKPATLASPAFPNPPEVQRRYPTLRFLVGFYKFAGVLILAGGMIYGLSQLVSSVGYGVMLAFGTLFASASLSGTCWLIGEGVELFIDMEENTRQSAVIAAEAAAVAPTKAEMLKIVEALASTTRLLEQVVATNQRLDGLGVSMTEIRDAVGAGVKAMETTAESSKVTATMLYRQVAKHN